MRRRAGVGRRAAALAVLLAALPVALPTPALAHKLKVFAAVKDGEIAGYAFFIGGGRPKGVPVEIAGAAGEPLYAGRTDAEGGFHWPAPGPGDYVVTVNAEDGHAASARIPAARFGGAATPAAMQSAAVQPAPPGAAPPGPTAPEIEALVTAAVQREVAPLLERIEAMDSRLRLTDVLSGVFLMLGAAGGALWLRGRGGAG